MVRLYLFIFISLLLNCPLRAQKLISSSGGVIDNNNSGSVSYSIGEPITSTINGGSNGDVTQGYQQSKKNVGTELTNISCDQGVNGYTPYTKNLHAINISADRYEFRCRKQSNLNIEYIYSNSTGKYFNFSLVGINDLNTYYIVDVRAFKNNEWTFYGDKCILKTPSQVNLNSPELTQRSCSESAGFSKFNRLLSATNLGQSVSAYKFRYREWDETTNQAVIPINEYTHTINGANGWRYSTMARAGITELNTAFMVDVSAEYNGIWSNYGNGCVLHTPIPSNLETSYLLSSSCDEGTDGYSSLTKPLSAKNVNASKYEFRFREWDETNDVEVFPNNRFFDEINNWRYSSMAAAGITEMGKAFKVDVRVKQGNQWSPYSSDNRSCILHTPTISNLPTTKLVPAFCDVTYNSWIKKYYGLKFYTLPGASKYDFEVTQTVGTPPTGVSNPATFTIQQNNGPFGFGISLHNLGFLNGTNGTPNQFEVKIKAYFGANDDEGNWGDVCTITTNPLGTDDFTIIDPEYLEHRNRNEHISNSTLSSNHEELIQLKLYPNPNNGDVINIEFLNEGLTNDLHVSILDINGRIIELRKINTETGLNKKEIILKTPLSKGIYFMQIKNGQLFLTKKIQVL